MIIYIIAMLFACFYVNAGEQLADTNQILQVFNTIPVKDQKEIKSLFKSLFFNDALAYSLFGDKPISFSTEILYPSSSNELVQLLTLEGYCHSILETYCEPFTILESQWKVWEKYKNLFQLKNFLFMRMPIGQHDRILIVNKKAFKIVFERNIKLFKIIIDDNISAEDLLRQIERNQSSLFDILHNNQGLIGILLGFGKYNSMLFQKREELLQSLGKNLKKIELIQKELETLNSMLQPLHVHDGSMIATINRVGFVADHNHIETINLRDHYDKLNREINEIYSKDDWFEHTLLQLTSED